GAECGATPSASVAGAGGVVPGGARPRFVDIEPEGYGMDPSAVAGAIGPRTLAVLPVHLFGPMCDLEPIAAGAGAVPIVEDAAQSIGAVYGPPEGQRAAGSIGLLGCLSFFPTKNLGGA